MNKKIAFKTLGCRLNQFETDALLSKFKSQNYVIVPFHKKADAYIINACTVTSRADKKVNYYINQALKNKKIYNAILLLIGCINDNLAENTQIDYLIKNNNKTALFDIVESHFAGNVSLNFKNLNNDNFSYPVVNESVRTRGMVKIQDGCNNFCSFCIIPQVRGKAVSRPYIDIINNAKQLIHNGFKEIVITGVNIAQYRYGEINFEKLLSALLNISGDFRIRISSIEPSNFSEKFYQLFKNKKLTPFIHLCLQSGSDKILKNMRRNYLMKDYATIVENLRKIKPDINISTDIIVGFPGESADDFKKSIEAINEMKFAKVHVFRFSNRDKTFANKLNEQIDEKIKIARSNQMKNISEEFMINYRKKFINKKLNVLIERTDKHKFSGYSENYLPIKLDDFSNVLKNEIYSVLITTVDDNLNLIGKPVSLS